MRRHRLILCALILALSGCGLGKNQSPVGSDDELGRTRAEAEEAKPANYVTQQGDSLRSIAARPEIYGDAELWPLLLDANETDLGSISPGKKLEAGRALEVPRSLSVDELDEAREKARQYAASQKASRPAKRPEPESPAAAKAPAKPAAKAEAVAAKPATAEPKPVPRPKSGGMLKVLFLLLLVLAAIGGVLYVFSRRDKQDKA